MSSSSCGSCGKSKSLLACGLCGDAVCKSCANFVEAESFSFYAQIPAELSHGVYCQSCFHATVMPAQEAYRELLERAREINVFLKNQGKETRLLKRVEKPVKVENCADREEAVLRLAFFAAQLGYNGLLDVELTSVKVREGSYQYLLWSGRGVPAAVRGDRLVRDRSIWSNPN